MNKKTTPHQNIYSKNKVFKLSVISIFVHNHKDVHEVEMFVLHTFMVKSLQPETKDSQMLGRKSWNTKT